MDVQDGFIIGIFNYCDRWCETCAFTSRCRVFADVAEAEAALDPNLKAIVDAPLLPQDVPPAPPRWIQELIEEMNEAASEPMSDEELKRIRPHVAPEQQSIHSRVRTYHDRVHAWLQGRAFMSISDPGDPRAVAAWFHALIPAKIFRALTGLASEVREGGDWQKDYDGSAKVALLGIQRSHAAWLEMVARSLASSAEVEPFIADLVWLGEELEGVFPNARVLVRPAFDEPDEVARMLAAESGR